MTAKRIFLVGLSGSGKSTVGQLLAERLGWAFADSDREVEREAGRAVGDIFKTDGEARFRELEAHVLSALCEQEPIVVATGGGAPTHQGGRQALECGFSVWLSVSPERAAKRLQASPGTEERPLLAGGAEARLKALLDVRRELYAQADAAIDVDELSPEHAAAEVVQLWEEWRAANRAGVDRPDATALDESFVVAATVRTPHASYPIIVQDGVLERVGAACRFAGLDGRAFVLTDQVVGDIFESRVQRALTASGYSVSTRRIPSGEEFKTLGTVELVYDWLIGERVERSDFVVCLGGGVVTDLGGFAAATCLRGIAFVHVPTSLLGMVDASIGGKTGVDHARGKNLIGAFAQPSAVVIDPRVLASLDERQLKNGWAEVIKHGFILDEELTRRLESVAGQPEAMMSAELIARSAAIKAAVASEDEREAGRRTLLNYGHTIGHAIEAVTGYRSYLHGEAVAVGMRAAGLIALELGMLAADEFERQQRLICAAGLPETAPGVSVEAVLDAAMMDKKVRRGDITWVLLERVGQATTRRGVPDAVVRAAVERVLGT